MAMTSTLSTMKPSQVHKMDGWQKFRQSAQVKSCDMVLEMETEAKDCIVMAIEKLALVAKDYEETAKMIKATMDKKFGGPWHVILGEGFGFDIVHQARQMIHLHVHKISCVCYKC